jgi:hypothetical protein
MAARSLSAIAVAAEHRNAIHDMLATRDDEVIFPRGPLCNALLFLAWLAGEYYKSFASAVCSNCFSHIFLARHLILLLMVNMPACTSLVSPGNAAINQHVPCFPRQ